MIELREEPVVDLREHARIPSVFESRSIFDVHQTAGGFELVERSLASIYRKNYDEFENPVAWPRDFDTSNWTLISAFSAGDRVGGLVAAANSPGIEILEGRTNLAVVWDLRVAPAHRRQSVASSLLCAAQSWASGRGCTELKVETQNTNVAACKLYLLHGFVLRRIAPDAYPELPEDVQLIWTQQIKRGGIFPPSRAAFPVP